MYENVVGTEETVRIGEVSVLERCLYWRGVLIERFECLMWPFYYGPEPAIN